MQWFLARWENLNQRKTLIVLRVCCHCCCLWCGVGLSILISGDMWSNQPAQSGLSSSAPTDKLNWGVLNEQLRLIRENKRQTWSEATSQSQGQNIFQSQTRWYHKRTEASGSDNWSKIMDYTKRKTTNSCRIAGDKWFHIVLMRVGWPPLLDYFFIKRQQGEKCSCFLNVTIWKWASAICSPLKIVGVCCFHILIEALSNIC